MRNYKTSFIQPTPLEETKMEEEQPTTTLDASQSYAKCQMGVKIGETKLLGVPWNKTDDSIEVNFPGPVINVTKREVLGEIAKIYDPLGLASPLTLVGKMLYREACDARTLWDYELPKELKSMWESWGGALPEKVVVSRSLAKHKEKIQRINLHTFGDASCYQIRPHNSSYAV